MKRPFLLVALLVASCAALATGCKKDEPKSTRWDDAAAAIANPTPNDAGGPAVPLAATGSLNKFFPKDGDGGYKRVFTADKEGYAEAKLQKDGKDMAVLSISDASAIPAAKAKFEGATDKVDGYPLTTLGKTQSSVLVKDRYQVKVSSPTLDPDARKAILGTFDLKGLGT